MLTSMPHFDRQTTIDPHNSDILRQRKSDSHKRSDKGINGHERHNDLTHRLQSPLWTPITRTYSDSLRATVAIDATNDGKQQSIGICDQSANFSATTTHRHLTSRILFRNNNQSACATTRHISTTSINDETNANASATATHRHL